jgi:hypothetical protein
MLKAFSPAERPVLADMLERFIGAVDDFVMRIDDPQPALHNTPGD